MNCAYQILCARRPTHRTSLRADREEFKKLLEASGYTGTEANALFAKIDKDGSGGLTQAEIKFLSQGKAGHVASG